MQNIDYLYSADDVQALTQEQAREWLIKYDKEAADYWRELPANTDFKRAVLDNCNDFGYAEKPIISFTEKELLHALNILRLARKESSQAFIRASYSKDVQPIFDKLDKE